MVYRPSSQGFFLPRLQQSATFRTPRVAMYWVLSDQFLSYLPLLYTDPWPVASATRPSLRPATRPLKIHGAHAVVRNFSSVDRNNVPVKHSALIDNASNAKGALFTIRFVCGNVACFSRPKIFIAFRRSPRSVIRGTCDFN